MSLTLPHPAPHLRLTLTSMLHALVIVALVLSPLGLAAWPRVTLAPSTAPRPLPESRPSEGFSHLTANSETEARPQNAVNPSPLNGASPAVAQSRQLRPLADGSLTDDLVAYWTLDEASGTRYDQLNGCGVDGCDLAEEGGTVNSTTGIVGNSADFAGDGKHLERSDHNDLSVSDGESSFTVSFWAYISSVASTPYLVAKAEHGVTFTSYEWIVYQSGDHLNFDVTNGTFPNYVSVSSENIILNTWSHVVAKYDSVENRAYIYINTEPQYQTWTLGSYDGTNPFVVGAGGNSGNSSDSLVDEIGFWKRALSDDEITKLYNCGNGLSYPFTGSVDTGLTCQLQAYWTLDEASGTRYDSVGSNDLTDNNTVGQATGKIDTAADFVPANSEYLSIADNVDLSVSTSNFTLSAWVYLDSTSGQMMIVNKYSGFETGAYQREYFLSYYQNKFRFDIYGGSGGAFEFAEVVDNTSVTTGVWYFIVAWHDKAAQTISIQVNGATPVNQAANNMSYGLDTAAPFEIGRYTGDHSYWDGRIDEVGFWKRVLTPTERTYLYNNGAGCTYPFTECAAPDLPPSQAFATNECPFCNNRSKVYTAGQGINVNSGNYNHQHADGQVAGVGARLAFERSYNSLTSGANSNFPTYNDVLGYGWTHSYNVRLILPGDPGGETGIVKLIAPRGSVMQFNDLGNGAYSPFPAVLAELTRTGSSGNYEYTVTTNSQYEYVFNNSQQLIKIFDPQDHQTTLTYTSGQLAQIDDASGARRLKLFYSSGRLDHLDYVKVSGGETVLGMSSYTYDGSGNLDSVTDLDGRTWDYVYATASNHLLTKVIDPSGKTLVETTFDSLGRATLQKDGDGKRLTEVLSYTGDTRQLRTDADDDSVTTTVTFSGGVPVSVDAPGSSDSSTTFNGYGINPGAVTDPNNNTTNLSWNANSNLTQVKDALSNTTDMQYDGLNNLIEATDDEGRKTKYEYAAGTTLLTKSIANYEDGVYESNEPDKDLITTYAYTTTSDAPEPAGLVRTQTDPRGIVTRYTYTALGQRATVTVNYVDGAAGPGDDDLITSYTYDDRGRILTTTDPLGRVTKNEYDSSGNLFRITRNFLSGQPQNHQTVYNLITEYEYDDAGRIEKTTDTLGQVSAACYDSAGRAVKTIQNPSVSDPCASYTPSADADKDRLTTTTYDGDSNVIATTGPDGVITRTYYDSLNRPVTVVQNLTGQAITVTTPPTYNSANPDQNVRSETVYDNAGNVLKTIDNIGRIIYTCYDALNRTTKTVQNPSVTNPCTSYTASTDADKDITTQTVYDNLGNVIATIDVGDIITRTYYDGLNRPSIVIQNLVGQDISVPTPPTYSSTYPDRNLGTQTFYDPAGRVFKTVDLPTNRASWTCYDDAGRTTRTVRNATVSDPCASGLSHSGGNDENLITEYTYDTAGRQIAVTAPDGVITRTYYDDADRRIAVTTNLVGQAITVTTPPTYNPANPDENITAHYEYDALGRTVKTTDNGNQVNYSCYDTLSRTVKSIQNPSVSTPCSTYTPSSNADQDIISQMTYDAKGDAIATTDPAGRIARIYFDALHRTRYAVENLTGQAITVTTPPTYNPANPDQNVRQEMKYDDAGRPFEIVDNAGMVTRTTYDLLDRSLSVIVNYVSGGPSDSQTNLASQTTYNKRGNVTDQTDANGAVTHFEYDAVNRLTAVVENYKPGLTPTVEINVRTEYTYDSRGNRLKIRNGNATLNGQQDFTTFTYDKLDRVLTETDPLGKVTTHTYSLAGTPATLYDANEQTTTYSYDDVHRLTTIDYPSGTTDATFTYDAGSNRKTLGDSATTTWSYDTLYRPLSTQHSALGTVSYTYNKLGLRTTLTYPDSKSVNYTFDSLNRLTGVTPSGTGTWGTGGITGTTYNAFGGQASIELPNEVTAAYTYNNAHRLTEVDYSTPNSALSTFTYTLDKVGNRTAVTETVRQPDPPFPAPDPLFTDGFESGNLNGWSSSATAGGLLSVTSTAALAGSYGLQAAIDGATSTASRYVTDTQPNAEPRYRARFYLDPNSITMADTSGHYIFYGYNGASTVVVRVEFGYTTAGGYRLRVALANDSAAFTNSSWVNLTDAPHYVELDWQAATAPGANDGSLNWWIDGSAQTGLTGIDNDTWRIDLVRWGAIAGIDTTTSGATYFDAFESRRQTQIGAGAALPDGIFANDFESGNLSYWTSSVNNPTVSTAASLSPGGAQGMVITLAGATTAQYVIDSTPTYEPRYRARFYLDPNSVIMTNASGHYLFYGYNGVSPLTLVLRVEFGYTTAGGYRLRVALANDSAVFTNSSWVNITDAPHSVELDWRAATAPGANDGRLNWWLDGSAQMGMAGVDNDTWRIDQARLGAIAGVDTTTIGAMYFDGFDSRRSSYIGLLGLVTTTIEYEYDPLYRLTRATYGDGRYFEYTYDAVGNRLTEEKCATLPCLTPLTTTYTYDIANRLTQVNSTTYAWDDNGNLLDDGPNTYTYDAANRLASFNDGTTTSTYGYNGLGDRLSQTVGSATTNYVLDLEAGLTQVLSDGANTYLYGAGRIGELQSGGWAYHLGDALGSVRQLADEEGGVTVARSYEPFGSMLSSVGSGSSVFAFAGEQFDVTGLSYNRARYYASVLGRFFQRDGWGGNGSAPTTLNKYLYGNNNPLIYTDPSGQMCIFAQDVMWLGGNPCTDEDRRWTAEALINYVHAMSNTVEFQLGIWVELGDTLAVGLPSIASEIFDQIADPTSPFRQYVGIACDKDHAYSSAYNAVIVNRANPAFQAGRLIGRLGALAIAFAELGGGAGANALSLLAALPSGGTSLAGVVAGTAVAGHAVAVMGAVAVKEISDPLILKMGRILYAAMATADNSEGAETGGSSGGSETKSPISEDDYKTIIEETQIGECVPCAQRLAEKLGPKYQFYVAVAPKGRPVTWKGQTLSDVGVVRSDVRSFHVYVIKDGSVYDRFTGYKGMLRTEYESHFNWVRLVKYEKNVPNELSNFVIGLIHQ